MVIVFFLNINKFIRMKIGILGATGMLGHKLLQVLSEKHEVYATCRSLSNELKDYGLFKNVLEGYEATNLIAFETLIAKERFDVIINCIGIIKQQKAAYDAIPSIEINSLFPHKINKICNENGTRFIHISTDCVFSGNKGSYTELDEPDAKDLYGKSKEMGEVIDSALTIRTSIIGHEISRQLSLVNWFLSQEGSVNGYRKAIYTGMPTVHLSKVILEIIEHHPSLMGLYQIASMPIDKYELLKIISEEYRKNIMINPYDDFINDKSLDSKKFNQETSIIIPEWKELINEMHQDFLQNEAFYLQMNSKLSVHNI
jgi:dTDP-4-dehydrorhamnose reductase